MKKILTNMDIVNILKEFYDQKSFRFNNDIKMPMAIYWPLRVNLEALEARKDLVAEAEKEIYDKYFTEETSVSTTDNLGQTVRKLKDEYQEKLGAQVTREIAGLYAQSNEMELNSIPFDVGTAFMKQNDGELSYGDMDLLCMFMNEEKKEAK